MPSRLLKLVRADAGEKRQKPASPNVYQFAPDLNRLEQEFLPPALEIQETPPSPVQRGVLWAIVALSGIAIGWSCIGELDVVATAPGKVIPDGKVKVLQSADNAIVRVIHVTEGQEVKQGELLVELDPTINNADLNSNAEKFRLTQLELARLTAELSGTRPDYSAAGSRADMVALQEALRTAREANFNAKVAEAMNNLQSKEMALAATHDILRKLEAMAKTAREKEEKIRPYVGQVMPRFDYLKLKDDLTQTENDVAAQINHVKEAQQSKAAAGQKLKQIQEEWRSQIIIDMLEKTNVLTALKGDVEKASQLVSQKELRAPIDGQVQSLTITTAGGVVTPAQTIATIVPKDSGLVIESVLSNEDIGFIKAGQKVDIKIDTFPFQKYGSLSGSVVWISPDAEERHVDKIASATGLIEDTRTPTKSGLMYKIRIKPDQTTLNIGGKPTPISAGMTVQADINTDKRRFIEFFLSPVLKYWDEGMKVR
jgi:hemolysin D